VSRRAGEGKEALSRKRNLKSMNASQSEDEVRNTASVPSGGQQAAESWMQSR
jgi:hypothetical protein